MEKLIRNLVPKKFRPFLRAIWNKILNIKTYVMVKNTFICRLSMFFDNQMFLDYRSIIVGNYIYNIKTKQRNNEYYLRRQIHRVEKGLMMDNRRFEFALDFILPTVETVINFRRSLNKKELFQYCCEVLSKYFEKTTSMDHRYLKAKKKFNELDFAVTGELLPKPYVGENAQKLTFAQLLYSRKSIRKFQSRRVDVDLINRAVELASRAPSGCNRQPYRFQIYDDKKSDSMKNLASLPPGGHGDSHGAPTIVYVIGDHSAYPSTASSHEAYIDATLATMIFVLSLEEMGVSSCFMNWPHIYKLNKIVSKELKLKEYEFVVTTVAIGYAHKDAYYAYSLRKNIKQLVSYNG